MWYRSLEKEKELHTNWYRSLEKEKELHTNVVQESGEREGTTHQGSEVSIIDLNNVVQEKEKELHTKVQK